MTLGALSAGVSIALMAVTVFAKAWPSFAHNGIEWFFPGGDVDQQLNAILNGPKDPAHYVYHLRAWPLLWGTIVTTALAVLIALVVSILAAVFIVELAPAALRRAIDPVVRLLAAVPSVVYGLIGILAIAPWVERTFISQQRKHSVAYVVQLTGANLSVAVLILALMIVPIMVALVVGALETVPRSWTEGSVALGVNRWRTMWRVSAAHRAPGDRRGHRAGDRARAGRGDHALDGLRVARVRGQPPDGSTFLFEPVRPLAATIIDYIDGISVVPLEQTLYAMAAVLLVSCAFLSLAAWVTKQPMKKYGIRA